MFSRLKRCFSDNRSICFVSIILTGIILNSCSVSYKFNGSSLDYTKTKTITIADFPNNATLVYPQLAPKLNTALKDIFNRRTKLQQVRRNGDMPQKRRYSRLSIFWLTVWEFKLFRSALFPHEPQYRRQS